MTYFDRKPRVFWFLALTLIILLVGIVGTTIYNYASSPNDENWFRDVPSNAMVVRNIPATLEQSYKSSNGTVNPEGKKESLLTGDLIVSFNDQKVRTYDDLRRAFHDSPAGSELLTEVLRPSLDRFIGFRIQRSDIALSDFRELPPVAHVFEVIPGGASDRAGMKAGDLIVRINNKEFKNANGADVILRKGQIGNTILYEVLRGNDLVPLQVTLARYGLPIQVVAFFLTGLLYMLFGAFLLLQRPELKAARMLGLFFLFVGYFVAGAQARRDVDFTIFVALRDVLGVCGLLFGVAIALRVTAFFPRERPHLAERKWIGGVLYGLAALGAIGVWVLKTTLMFNVVFVMLAFALVMIFRFRKFATAEDRKLSRVIKWSGALAGLVALLSNLPLKIFTVQQQAVLIAFILLLIPLSYAYTIGRYRLLDLNLRIRRNVQYSLVSVLWGGGLAIVLIEMFLYLPTLRIHLPNFILTGTSVEITDAPALPEQQELVQRVFFMVAAVAVFFLLHWFRKKGQEVIDRKYYRTQYDYRRATSELADVLSTKLSMVDLGRGVVEKVAELMQLKRAGVLFFRSRSACCCQEAHGFDGHTWKEFCVVNETAVIEALTKFTGPFRVDYLPVSLREEFEQSKFRYIIPVRSKDELVGAILVGEKLSESPFHQEDFEFLGSAANQASVSIENAFLYEELAEKERMKHELEIARKIQLESLPQETPVISGLDISGSSNPAMEVGGDFFDYLNGMPDEITVIVGDVSGKGTSAALYMSKVQGIFRSLHEFNLTPKDLLVRANRLLCRDLERRSFVTVLGATFNVTRRSVSFARAGHLPLLVYRAGAGSVQTVTPKGLGLGLNDEQLFVDELQQENIDYQTGDVILFVTDGVTEARRSDGEQFGEDRVRELLVRMAGESADSIRMTLLADVKEFAGDSLQHDDETVVVVKSV